ncbi:MAG: hypothetical protein ABFD92_17650 [Planctomycetaceae bacterium]|nr:hypothetical protein [Planctomycetaceae bacterium]
MIIAHHIILTGYGHWLPNDPRGSLSRSVYKDSIESMRTCIRYIESNPEKHNLPAQKWGFVTSYDDWPFHKTAH